MNTNRETVVSGCTQAPLLHVEQVRIGVYVTGMMAQHVWEVIGIDQENRVLLKKASQPQPALCQGDHHFQLIERRRGLVCSRCQLRRQGILDLLPLTEDKARFHVVTPHVEAMRPEAGIIYGGVLANRHVHLWMLDARGLWSEPLPIGARLHTIWSLPSALRPFTNEHRTQEPSDEVGGTATPF